MALVAVLALFFASVNIMLHPDVTVVTTIEISGHGLTMERIEPGPLSDAVLNRAIDSLAEQRPGLTAGSLRERLTPVGHFGDGKTFLHVWYQLIRSRDEKGDVALLRAVGREFAASQTAGTARVLYPSRSYQFPQYGGLDGAFVAFSGVLCLVTVVAVVVTALRSTAITDFPPQVVPNVCGGGGPSGRSRRSRRRRPTPKIIGPNRGNQTIGKIVRKTAAAWR